VSRRPSASPVDVFFASIEQLSFRDMHTVAGLIVAVLEARDVGADLAPTGPELAQAMVDAAEGHRELEDEES
jgi:hypothetical protein